MSNSWFVRASILLGVCASPALAQCADFADGFAIGASGFTGSSSAATVFDDGTGPTVFAVASGGFLGNNRHGVWKWSGPVIGWQAIGPSFYGSVYSLCVFDDGNGASLYVAGDMGTADSIPVARVLRWDGSAFQTVGNSGPDATVYELCVHDDGTGAALYAAGSFANVDGAPMARVARWNGTAWSSLGSGCTGGEVRALASFVQGPQRRLIAGGAFTQAGSVAMNRIAQWDGTSWSTMGSGLAGPQASVNDLHVADLGSGPLLYVGGTFTSAGGSPATHIARWTGSAWFGIPNFPSSPVTALGSWDDGSGRAVFVSGPLSVGGLATNGIARWSGTSWSALGAGLVGSAITLVEADLLGANRLWMFGSITQAGGKPSGNVAVWGVPCWAPTVTQAPLDVVARWPATLDLDVEAQGTMPLTYQWRRNGVPIANALNVIEGATTDHLRLWRWSLDDAGAYDCVVSNSLGSDTSAAAIVTVPAWTPNGLPQPLEARVQPGAAVGSSTVTTTSNPLPTTDGAIQFDTRLALAGNGLYQARCEWRAGTVTSLVKNGDPAPGFPAGTVIDRYDDNPIRRATSGTGGSTVVHAHTQGPGVTNANDEGIFYADASGITLVARESDFAPGLTPTTTFYSFQDALAITNDGRVVVNANWRDGTVYGGAVWTWTPGGGLVLVLKTGDPVPGSSATFAVVGSAGLLGPGGGLVVGGEFGPNYQSGCFLVSGGIVTRISGQGDPAPGFPPGSVFVQAGATHANAAGQVLVTANVQDGIYQRRGLYVWGGAGLTPIAVYGQFVPNVGTNDALGSPVALGFNDMGRVLFSTTLQGPCGTCPTYALFLAREGNLNLITTNQVDAAGGSFDGQYAQFPRGALDSADRVVFSASMFPSGNGGLYGWTLGTPVFPIATPGQQVQIPSGAHRTISGAQIVGARHSPNADGPSSCAENAGEIVFELSFQGNTDGGIFRANWDSLATLYVLCPVVAAPPEPQWVVPGSSASFSVVATGGAPLSYRWTKNGVDLFDGSGISGTDTAVLGLANATNANDGEYAVRITNPCGRTTSASARLEVTAGLPFCAGDNSGSMWCPCQPSESGQAVGCLNSLGVGGKLRAQGVASVSGDTLALLGSLMPNSSALYFQGTAQAGNGNGVRFGDGLRCASGSVLRLGTKLNSTNSSQYPAAGDAPVTVRGQVTVPGVRTYQVWYRNAANFCASQTFNLTNGLVVTWLP